MSDDKELIERLVSQSYAIAQARDVRGTAIEESVFRLRHPDVWKRTVEDAEAFLKTVRAYDREQRAKIDEALARHNEARHGGMNMYVETRRDPDDYRDPFSLVTRMARGPGITEG